MIAHDRSIVENAASDRQRLYENTFQRCDLAIVGNPIRISDTSDREHSYGN